MLTREVQVFITLESTAAVWDDLDREQPRSEHYRGLLRQERQLLEGQARRSSCTLIITPLIDPGPVGPLVHRIRIETLIGFLESIENDLVDIVFADSFSLGNETILGDVLLARALPPQPIGTTNKRCLRRMRRPCFGRVVPSTRLIVTSVAAKIPRHRGLKRTTRARGPLTRFAPVFVSSLFSSNE